MDNIAVIFLIQTVLVLLLSPNIEVKRTGKTGIGLELLVTSNRESYHKWHVPLTGRSPSWLKGTLIKNGPGQFEEGPTSFTHAFDGFAKLAMFNFTGNQSLQFSTKVLPSKSYNSSMHYGDIAPYLYFRQTNPPFCEFKKLQAILHNADNCPVNLYKFASSKNEPVNETSGKVAVIADIWNMYLFNIDNFLEIEKVEPSITEGTHTNHLFPVLSSAHPIQEYNKNTFITILSELNPIPWQNNALHLVRILSNKEREVLVTVPIDKIAYMHSFGLSLQHAVLFYDPLFLNMEKMLESATLSSAFIWTPEEYTTIYVINLATKYVFHIEAKRGIHLHHVNTYEEAGHLITDFVVYPDPYFLFNVQLDALKNATFRSKIRQNCTLVRYDIDLKKETVKRHKIQSVYKFVKHLELPTINEAFRFKKYCFIYGITTRIFGNDFSEMAIVKKDLCQGEDLVWAKTYHYVSEPTFIANPRGKREDDGVVTAIILDGLAGLSYVLVLNAHTFEVLEVAYLPTFVPTLIHGRFFKEN